MNAVLLIVVATAALVFITVSAVMNALFLSSLGRTGVEVALLAMVSVTADVVKAVLPIMIVRAIGLRAWGQGLPAAALLIVVVALSLASGTGFAALTRGTATAARDNQADRVAATKRELADVEAQIAALALARPITVVDAELSGLTVDRRWAATKFCTDITGPAARTYCADVFKLRVERAIAAERHDLVSRRLQLRASFEALSANASGTDSDPQAAALAELLGVDRKVPRLVMTTGLAVLLELGSVVLVLLLFGVTLRDWREPEPAPAPPIPPAKVLVSVPEAKDRAYWRKQTKST